MPCVFGISPRSRGGRGAGSWGGAASVAGSPLSGGLRGCAVWARGAAEGEAGDRHGDGDEGENAEDAGGRAAPRRFLFRKLALEIFDLGPELVLGLINLHGSTPGPRFR